MSFKSFDELRAACQNLDAGDAAAERAVAQRQDTLTKPQGSLGRLEGIAAWLARWQGRAMPLLMQFAMYVTPVVFPMPKQGWAATLFSLNPATPLILTARDWLTGQTPEYLGYFLAVNVIAAAFLLVVWGIYRLAMPILIERMGG